MILTLPVLLYQLLFVAILLVARRFGRLALGIATALCLAWTATHLFFPPLAVVQTAVIVATAVVLFRRPDQDAPSPSATEGKSADLSQGDQ